MGFFMLAGLVGTVVYGSYVVKKDIESEITDYCTSPTLDKSRNRFKMEHHFERICNRCGIKLENGNPISDRKLKTAIQYLQYQGYTEEEIEYFTQMFNERYELRKNTRIEEITEEVIDFNKRLQIRLRVKNAPKKMIVFRPTIYKSSLSPQERIDKLLENEVWNQIVDHQSYIPSMGSGKWDEVWSLVMPIDFLRDTNIEKVYRNICILQQVEYTI